MTALHALLALAAVTLVAHITFRLHGRRARRSDRPSSRFRRAFAVGLPFVAVAAFLALVLTDAPALVHDAILALAPPLIGTGVPAVVVQVVVGLGVVAAVLAGYLGAFPHVRAARGLDIATAAAARRFGRQLVALLVVVVAAAQGHSAAVDALGPTVGHVVTLAGLVVVGVAGAPWFVAAARTTRELTGDECERLSALLGADNLDLWRVRCFDAAEEQAATVTLRGVPGRRVLFVSDHLLDALDREVATAVVAAEIGRERHGYTAYRASVVAVVFTGIAVDPAFDVFATAAAVLDLPAAAVLMGALVGTVALMAGGKRLVYRGDDYAADRLGAATVADALEAVAAEHDHGLDAGRLGALVRMRPSLGRRIDRLRRRAAAD